MKVAILGSRGIPGRYGAFETLSEKLGLGLLEMGHEVTVSCPHNQEYQENTYLGIRLEFVYHASGALATILYDVLSLWKASRSDHDVLLMLGYGSSPFCAIPKLFGKPIVINTDGLEWRRTKWPWYAKLWLRLAERAAVWVATELVSDSKAIAQYYRDQYKRESTYIPYGTETFDYPGTEILAAHNLKRNDYYIVVMRMEPENSVREIVEAFLIAETTRPLVLVGPSTPFFEKEVRPLYRKDPGKVRYVGPIYNRRELFQLRQNAYAYIHGHTVGGTNPTLVEAMACGNVIIARDVKFNREVVEDLAFYFNTSLELVDCISKIEGKPDPELSARKLGAIERAFSEFSWKRICDAYSLLFVKAVGAAAVGHRE